MHSTHRGWPVLTLALWLCCSMVAAGEPGGSASTGLFPNLNGPEPGTSPSRDGQKDDPFSQPLFPDLPSPTPRTARNERALFALAGSYFDQRAYQLTADTLRDFLQRYPSSHQAAEARYRLALALHLQGNRDEAARTFEELLDRHPQSPYARLVLEMHTSEEDLRGRANDELRRARDPDRHDRARTALDLLELYRKRFPDGSLKREVLVYKLAVCHRLLDQRPESQSALKSILEYAPRTAWARLASCWLDRGEYFAKHLDEIPQLHASGEELLTFLDLAEELGPRLKPAARIHCLFLQGRCLHHLHRDLEAEKIWRKLIQQHPHSPEAPEALFWLAEHFYQAKDVIRAQEAYEALLQHYPDSPRAGVARRWLAWLDQHDETWAAAERLLAGWVTQTADCKGAFAFGLRIPAAGSTDLFRCRAAVQDPEHYLIQLALGGQHFLLASNSSGGWYRCPLDSYIVHTRERIPLTPIPHLHWKIDPATGAFSCWLATGSGGCESSVPASLKLPSTWASQLVTWLQASYHIHCEAGRGGRTVYRLEAAQESDNNLTCWEVETDAQVLRGARYTFFNDKQERVVWELSDVQLGAKLPPSLLSTRLPEDLPVQHRARLSSLDLLGDLCKIASKLLDSAPDLSEAAEVAPRK